jgi:type II secretory pathway component PulF
VARFSLRKLNPPAIARIIAEAHTSALDRLVAVARLRRERRSGVGMMKSKLSPREIVQRLQMIETLTEEGLPVAEALRSVGMGETEYERWRSEYSGLGRTLGPFLSAAPTPAKRTRRTASSRKPVL